MVGINRLANNGYGANTPNLFQNSKSNQKKKDVSNNITQVTDVNKLSKSEEQRKLLRNLSSSDNNQQKKTFANNPKDIIDTLYNTEKKTKDKAKAALKYKYNYKDVSSQIQRAKTTVSAGKAVLSAKRKVLEIKRKISSGSGDAEELQMALTHAKRMEMAAKKKMHHLELEEMVENTSRRDDKLDKMEKATQGVQSALADETDMKISEAADEIFEERQDMLDEALDEAKDSGIDMSDEMIAELNELISEFGEEELKQLEEMMEMAEEMEIINPHMSEDDLKELKLKHRISENKDIVKADMDYLKSMIKYLTEKQGSGSVNTTATSTPVSFSAGMVAAGIAIDPAAEVAEPQFSSGSSFIDVQL